MKDKLSQYLKNNRSEILIHRESIEDLTILDSDIKNSEIFLAGENHGVLANVGLKIKFIRYFKKKTNFNYYLCELPYSLTYFLNLYLKSGDEAILEDIYKALEGTDAWNKEEYNHWKDIYRFNKELSYEDKILAIGIDIEHQPKNALKFIEYIFYREEVPEMLERHLDSIIDTDNISNEDLIKFSKTLRADLIENESEYDKIFKEEYFSLLLVVDNILSMTETYDGNNFDGIRDKAMYRNFLILYDHLPRGKYFGQMGLSHIFQRDFPYVDWFASGLNRDENFKGRVISIAYSYKDCKYLYPTKRKNYIGRIDTLDKSMDEIESLSQYKHTIFKLNSKDSPFAKELIWPLAHKIPNGGVTTDYFQYLVVIKDSEAMEGIEIQGIEDYKAN